MKILFLFTFSILLYSCTRLPSGPPPTASTTIIINSLSGNCYSTASGTNFIDFDGTLTVRYASNVGMTILNEVLFSSPTTATKFPIQISTQIPNNNTPFEIEINITGRNCSRCASGYGTSTETTGHCFERLVVNGYEVAYPRWQLGKNINTYSSQIVFNNGTQVANKPNSCYTCIVPF